MNIDKVSYKGWKQAYRLTLGEAEMIVVTEIGPRVLSLSVGGENLLFNDPDTLGAGQGDAEWHIYGGHRLWISPEREQTYAPDNAPCEVAIEGETLLAKAPPERGTKLQSALRIAADGQCFVVDHLVTNTGEFLQSGSVWALTCVVPAGKVCFPWGRPGPWHTKKILFWRNWSTHSSDVTSRQWQMGPDLFVIDPTGEEGKVGTANYEGWMALARGDATFVKSFEHLESVAYPDDNCSMEAYTCERFIEMETLSPLATFHPGQTVCHRERWLVSSRAVDVSKPDELRRLAQR